MIAYTKNNSRAKDGFGLIGILIVVAVVALIGGGGLYMREMQHQKSIEQMGIEKIKEAEALKQKIEEQQKQAQEMSGEKSATTNVDTSTWKIYRNEKYGFEVKYPQNFLMQEGSAHNWVVIKSAENVDMYLQIQSLNQSPVPFSRYTPWGAHFVGYVILGNKQAEKYHTDHAIGEIGRNNGNPFTDYVIILGPKKYIEFQYFGSGASAVLFENILSTFKFTK